MKAHFICIYTLLCCIVLIEGAHVTAHIFKNNVHGWVIQYCPHNPDDDW